MYQSTVDEIAEAVAKSIKLLAVRGRVLIDDAGEGMASFIRHGDGVDLSPEDALDDLFNKFPTGVADDSAESVSAAIGKSHRTEIAPNPGAGFPPDPKGIRRSDDAVAAARRAMDPHLRTVVDAQIGPNSAIKSMEEFEALRHIRAENLTPPQVASLNTIRVAMGLPAISDDLVKVVDLNSALTKLSGGDPNLTGFFVTKADLGSPTTSQQMIDSLRLDFDNTPFSGSGPHVVIETKMTDAVQAQSRIPREGGYLDGNPLEMEIPSSSRGYPNTGNGMISSKDGRLRPEWRMESGTAMPPDVTVMKFKNADGSPKVVTVDIDGVPTSASDWTLTLVSADPDVHQWMPLP